MRRDCHGNANERGRRREGKKENKKDLDEHEIGQEHAEVRDARRVDVLQALS